MTDDRRKPDPRLDALKGKVDHLHDCVESLKRSVAENTEITQQVRDILASFRIAGSLAKWVTAIATAVAGVYAMLRGFRQ